VPRQREKQLAYSLIQDEMLNEQGRRTKAAKIVAVTTHFLGTEDLSGLTVVDVGCSVGFVPEALREHGARAVGVDIDVPGLAAAKERFGQVHFLCTDGERLPFPDESVDLIVFNQIYEHVVDPYAVMAELRRILKPTGLMYLGLGNRLNVMEPHHKLPFLSYLPAPLADRYVRAFKKADHYHERFFTRPGLKRLCRGLYVHEYTWSVLAEADRFSARDMVPKAFDKVPPAALRVLQPIMPTFIWVATKTPIVPKGPALTVPPLRFRA
jgi:SAM-dependent methyltransferase